MDDYQGRGTGKLFGGALPVGALQTRIRRFTAQVLANNVTMRTILDSLGATSHLDSGAGVATTVDVPDPAA